MNRPNEWISPRTAGAAEAGLRTVDAVRVLFAEDVQTDAELSVRELKRAGMRVSFRIADTEDSFRAALHEFRPDVILSDFSMPQFDGMSALYLARELAPETPFLFVSGTLGEEYAIRALKNGATDYVLKTNLIRLPAAIERALAEATERASRREMQARLDDLHERMRAIFETLPDAVWSIALPAQRLIYISPAASVVFGHAPEEFEADAELRRRIVHAADRERVDRVWAQLRAGTPYESEYRIELPDGRTRWILERAHAVNDATGVPVRLDGIARDVTEHVAQRERLARLARIRELLGATNAAIVRLRARHELLAEFCRIAVDIGGFVAGRVVELEPGTQRLKVAVATDAAETLGRVVEEYNQDPQGSRSLLAEALRTGQPAVSNEADSDLRAMLRDLHGRRNIRSVGCFPLVVADRTEGALVVAARERGVFDDAELHLLAEVANNLSFALERARQQERLDFLAYYDPATGLANRKLFCERLDQAVSSSADSGRLVALLVFDIDRFKTINDTLGMAAGDRLLQDFARRLQAVAGERLGCGRLGANEFGLLVPNVTHSEEVGRLLTTEVTALLDTIIEFEGRELRVAARAGVALCPEDGTNAELLLRNAEAALKKAKASAERFVFYAPSLNARVAERLDLESKVRRAVDRLEFAMHYQPKLRLADRTITGVEALLRWPGASADIASPVRFVPVLEETGLIEPVGRWLLREAVSTYRAWRAAGLPAPRIAVNVSAAQLRRSDFVDTVRAALAGSGECGLDLEITESLLMENIEESCEKLRKVRELGVHIALDDFGTGYSSLGYLSKLPIDVLKIDRSFVHGMTDRADEASIVAAMISLGKTLNLTVVAEGVETEDEARLLRLLHCDQIQGYLFSAPVSREALEELLRRHG
jgi:diguanylate cyclase (GGDEF)-like protein/PAS domain S-box-containing protein